MDLHDIEATWHECHKPLGDGTQERHLRGVLHFPKQLRQQSLPAGVSPLHMVPPPFPGWERGPLESSWACGVLHVAVVDRKPPELEVFPLPTEGEGEGEGEGESA